VVSLDYEEKMLRFRSLSDGRVETFSYDEDIEAKLLRAGKKKLSIKAKFSCDSQAAEKMQSIVSLRYIDLSVMLIDGFNYNGKKIFFKTPLTITPHLDESQNLFIAVYKDLNINVYSPKREELFSEIDTLLAIMWHDIALKADSNISPGTLSLKKRLLESVIIPSDEKKKEKH
jgi:hypothetical protein